MSKLVTFEQAVNLCELGFNEPCWRTYIITSKNLIPKGKDGRMNKNSELCKGYYSAPTVSSALDYLREEKGVACSVNMYCVIGEQEPTYCGEWRKDINMHTLDATPSNSFPEAESVLLSAVLEYLIEKEK